MTAIAQVHASRKRQEAVVDALLQAHPKKQQKKSKMRKGPKGPSPLEVVAHQLLFDECFLSLRRVTNCIMNSLLHPRAEARARCRRAIGLPTAAALHADGKGIKQLGCHSLNSAPFPLHLPHNQEPSQHLPTRERILKVDGSRAAASAMNSSKPTHINITKGMHALLAVRNQVVSTAVSPHFCPLSQAVSRSLQIPMPPDTPLLSWR